MSFSERFLAGFALAATIAKDPGARLAEHGLAESIASGLTRTARELSELDKAERRARIRTLTEPKAYTLPAEPSRPLRAYALLARKRRADEVPHWLRAAALPRPGYVAERALTALLARTASRTPSAAKEEGEVERWGE
jgi:hypothetical protein